jgi:hypothetical protein
MRKAYRAKNGPKLRQKALAYYWENRDKVLKQKREAYRRTPKTPPTETRRSANRERVRSYRRRHAERLREREKTRMETDATYAFARRLRSRVGKAVKVQYSDKAFKTMEVIGCSMTKLLAHLERQFLPGMTWDNYGRYGWHIDHIIPCASFDLSRPDHQKKCFHFSNLRPAWSRHNEGKGSRIEGELPLRYLHKAKPSR